MYQKIVSQEFSERGRVTKSISAQEASNVLKVVAQGAASVLNLGSDWISLDQLVAADGLRVLKYCAGFSKKQMRYTLYIARTPLLLLGCSILMYFVLMAQMLQTETSYAYLFHPLSVQYTSPMQNKNR